MVRTGMIELMVIGAILALAASPAIDDSRDSRATVEPAFLKPVQGQPHPAPASQGLALLRARDAVALGLALTLIAMVGLVTWEVHSLRSMVRQATGQTSRTRRESERPLPGGPEPAARRPRTEHPVAAQLPAIKVCAQLVETMTRELEEFSRTHPGIETGHALIGHVQGRGQARAILINGLISAGPGAQRSAGYLRFDRAYQQRELDTLNLYEEGLGHVGDAHLHSGAMDFCSSGDWQTDVASVRASATQEMIFVIATLDSRARPTRGSIHRHGLKLSFYYLGTCSGYQYVRVTPELVNEPMVTVGPALSALADADPVRARLDFANLRRLTNYDIRVSEIAARDGGAPRACVCARHRAREYTVLIETGDAPLSAPSVFVETGGRVMQYTPAFLNEDTAAHIWFAPLVLAVEREFDPEAWPGKASWRDRLLPVRRE